MKQDSQNQLLKLAEVSRLIGLSKSTIRAGRHKTNELLRIPFGRSIRFSLVDVQQWIARRIEEAQAAQIPKPRRAGLYIVGKMNRREINQFLNKQRG